MKHRFFNTVSVLLVFVAFAVFPMSLEADPGSDENQYEMNKVNSEAGFTENIRFINITKYITLNNECKDDTSCNSQPYRVPKRHTLTIQSISIGAGLAVGLDPSYSPYATIELTIPFPDGEQMKSHIIGTLEFSVRLDSNEGHQAILSKEINLTLRPETTFYINVKTHPNVFNEKHKMHVTVLGYLYPFDPSAKSIP